MNIKPYLTVFDGDREISFAVAGYWFGMIVGLWCGAIAIVFIGASFWETSVAGSASIIAVAAYYAITTDSAPADPEVGEGG